eukprot:s103_g21.t1
MFHHHVGSFYRTRAEFGSLGQNHPWVKRHVAELGAKSQEENRHSRPDFRRCRKVMLPLVDYPQATKTWGCPADFPLNFENLGNESRICWVSATMRHSEQCRPCLARVTSDFMSQATTQLGLIPEVWMGCPLNR